MPCDTSRRHGRQDFLEKFGATFRLEYDKYFDGTEMEALDPEAFAGASGKAVLPVKAVTTGNATELLPESLGKLSGSSSNLRRAQSKRLMAFLTIRICRFNSRFSSLNSRRRNLSRPFFLISAFVLS